MQSALALEKHGQYECIPPCRIRLQQGGLIMKPNYAVRYNKTDVGEVTVHQEGLYLKFHCLASLPKNDIYRLQLLNGNNFINLGVLLPVNGHFELRKSIPFKTLCDDKFDFEIIADSEEDSFFAVTENQPFLHINRLHLAKFTVQDGIPGVLIPNH